MLSARTPWQPMQFGLLAWRPRTLGGLAFAWALAPRLSVLRTAAGFEGIRFMSAVGMRVALAPVDGSKSLAVAFRSGLGVRQANVMLALAEGACDRHTVGGRGGNRYGRPSNRSSVESAGLL